MRGEPLFKERRRKALTIVFGIVLVVWGISHYQAISEEPDNNNSSSLESTINKSEQSEQPEIEYIVINREPFLPYKVSYDIRIPKKYSEPQLKVISWKLERRSQSAEKVFVVFYLPGMIVNEGGWATAHKGEDVKIMEFMLENNPTTLED